MQQRTILKLLPTAMKALKASALLRDDRVSILKEYSSYVSGFGPSVRTSGLNTVLSFYSDQYKERRRDANKPRRYHVLEVMKAIYMVCRGEFAMSGQPDLLTLALNTHDNRQLTQDLMDISIALKLVLRNFNLIDVNTAE
jgi:CRISPR/Cas system CMR-associated protein Cmr5 small subunit